MRTRSVACFAAIAAIAASTNVVNAQDAAGGLSGGNYGSEQRVQARIHVDVENVDLRDVMDYIGRQVGKNILVDPSVHETVTVSLRDIAWQEAVFIIARMTRCEVEELRGGILVLTQPPKVTIQFTEANVRTVLQLLAAYSGKNIIIAPQIQGLVTLDLKEVHWLRALYAIVKTVGPYEVVEETSDLLRVVPRSAIEQQLETKIFPLRYVRPPAEYRAVPPRSTGQGSSASVFVGGPAVGATNPEDSFTLLRALRTVIDNSNIQGAALDYDTTTNAFVVTATAPLLRQLKVIIDKIDVRPAMVYTEVRFVSTRDNNNFDVGVEFSPGSSTAGLGASGPFPSGVGVDDLRPTGFDQNAQATAFAFEPQPAGQFPFFFGRGRDQFTSLFNLPAVLNLSGLDMALNMIDRDDRSRIVQSPSLFMTDNQDAVIFVGENVPYGELTATVDANGNVVNAVAEGRRSPVAVGFSLFIQPHVIPNEDRIHMTVIPRVNDLVGTTSPITGFERFGFGNAGNIDLPRTREQALVTQVMLDDTETAVLGGLLTETETEVIKKVPILSSVPILGNIFTKRTTTKRVENLTIFITPTLVRQRSVVNSIFMRATRRLEETDYFYQTRDVPTQEDEEVELPAEPIGDDEVADEGEATDEGFDEEPAGDTGGE
ncbi:hypothetical protein OAX78_01375 [Planctomycetota bacterium]|nr:hypothetical protein [Planctomycetota bacterium]